MKFACLRHTPAQILQLQARKKSDYSVTDWSQEPIRKEKEKVREKNSSFSIFKEFTIL